MKNLASVFLFVPYSDASDFIILLMSTLPAATEFFGIMKVLFNFIVTKFEELPDLFSCIILKQKIFSYY